MAKESKETMLERDVKILRTMLENPNLEDMRTLRELHNWIIGMEVDLAMEIKEKLEADIDPAPAHPVRAGLPYPCESLAPTGGAS
jgi:hypothetical protein